MVDYLFLLIALALNSMANVILKMGAVESAKRQTAGQGGLMGLLTNFLDMKTIIAVVLFGLNIFFYKQALTRLPVSIAYPAMSALGLIVVFSLSFILLGERLSIQQLIGFCVIIAGVILVTTAGKAA